MAHNRSKLPEFISLNSSYDILKKIIICIEKKYFDTNKHIWNDLMLGMVGYSHNLQNAIYELPTYELVNCILRVMDILVQIDLYK